MEGELVDESIPLDRAAVGEQIWDRFNVGREDTLWYCRTLADAFKRLEPGPLADELDATVARLEQSR